MSDESRAGLLFAGGAFLFWGLAPLYWKLLSDVASMELLAHRLIWSLPILWCLVFVRGSWSDLQQALRQPKTLLTLLVTTVLIASNWFVFIWAVAAGRVLEASLGYFITPLFSVLLGYFILKERPRRMQWVSITLATVGVLVLILRLGKLPWVALALTFSFGLYGLLRKTVDASPVAGLTFEVSVVAPLAACWLAFKGLHQEISFLTLGLGRDLLLLAAGPVTVVPLIWFTHGARRLQLATLGLLQYLAPSCHFLLAVFLFGEEFSRSHLLAFGLIWSALILYTGESLNHARQVNSSRF